MKKVRMLGLAGILALAGALGACSDDDNTNAVCGNGLVEGSEQCDQTNLDGQTCADVGDFTGGSLACTNVCTLDTSGCTSGPVTCGNGDIDTGEDCDGDNLNEQTCADVGNYVGGTLSCDGSCKFVTAACTPPLNCGNGNLDTGEECDGTNLNNRTCASLPNFVSGDLACANDCTFDTGDCVPDTSGQIASVIAAANNTTLDLDINGAWVTYIKPTIGHDDGGFFLQAAQTGPAVFVAIDPSTLTPALAVGDEVDLTVTEKDEVNGTPTVTAITGLSRVSQSNNVASLVQTVTTATDLVSALDDYGSELITVDATIVSDFSAAGSGFSAADVESAAVTGNPDLELRLPAPVLTTLGIGAGCKVTVTQTPLWRYDARAQISAWNASEVTVNSCPAPQVLSAVATGEATVVVTFDRNINAASITNVGTQFAVTQDGGLTVSDFSVAGAEVTLVTSTQTASASYLLTVATSVTDDLGVGVDANHNTAYFWGFDNAEHLCGDGLDNDLDAYVDCLDADCYGDGACNWGAQLYLWESDADTPSTDVAEYLEVYNNTGSTVDFSTSKYFVILVNGGGDVPYHTYQLTGTLADGDVFVLGNVSGADLSFSAAQNAYQNGADGVLLVQCDACTDASTDFSSSTNIAGATFTTDDGKTATRIDALAYDTDDGDDSGLMTLLGVSTQWNENMGGDKDHDALQRISPTRWLALPATPGVVGAE